MKKRLLSMLMAVLMIASLVPAAALADSVAPAEEDFVINQKADAATKTPGITVQENEDGTYTVKITPFLTKVKDQCKPACTNLVTKELIKATCEHKGLTVYYCGTCGKAMMTNIDSKLESEALGHNYKFTVVEKPTCVMDGWGYAVCATCGKAEKVMNSEAAFALLPDDASEATVMAVEALFAATDHVAADKAVAVTKDVKDENGRVILTAAKAPTHVATVGLDVKNSYEANQEKIVWLDKDGNFVQPGTTATRPDGAGYTADMVCPNCDVKTDGHVVTPSVAEKGLLEAHLGYMSVIKEGYLPYKDVDKEKVDGVTDVVYCAKCNKTFGGDAIDYDTYFEVPAEEVTPAIGTTMIPKEPMALANDVVAMPAKAATCRAEGYTGDTVTYSQTGIDKDGKPVGAWVLTAKGEKIKMLDHHFVALENKAATCTEPGMKYVGCYVCDNVIGKDDNGKDMKCGQEKTDFIWENEQVAPLGHKWVEKVLVEATCQNTGLSVRVCSVCGEYQMVQGMVNVETTAKVKCVAAADRVDAKEATCTEAGYTGDAVCKWCGKLLEKGEEIPALGHKTEIKDAKAATCTEAGYTGDEVCTVCGETVKKGTEIPALGHKFENGVCTVCGAADSNYVVPNPFKDVEKTSPYYDAIIWAAKEKITTGKTADTFGIDEGCTRAQIVTFLYRAAGSPEVKADTVNPFTDVSKDSVYYNAILWAVEKGITKGTTATTFDPNAVCTRGQIVTFLFRASGAEKVATGTDFTDVASGSYCADAVAWAVANKVANGFGDGTFRPEATCTRGQAVTFIYRALAE